MGYVGKLQEKKEVLALRNQGLSYREIQKKVPLSKDTISRWCKNILLTSEQSKKLIENRILGQHKGSIVAANNKREKKFKDMQILKYTAQQEISIISEREKFLIGAALYAAEGTKMDGKGAFTNSDPKLLIFIKDWLINCVKINPKKLRCRIWLREDLSEQHAKDFWSTTLKIPKNQFIKTYTVKKTKNKITKNLHNYGICAIIFYDTNAHRQIMSWISVLFNDKILPYSPVAQW